MKKLPLILVAIILIVIAILPIIGNKFMQDRVADEITLLSSHGLKIQKVQTQTSYLSTKKHFEFIVENSADILKILNHYAKYQVSSYNSKLLNGFVVGADISYSNIPFAKTIDFDIYPLAMSPQMQTNMKAEDVKFYKQFSEFLSNKGILYHVEYNLINSDFKGYIKDIDKNYTLQNGSLLEMKLTKATFKGSGELINPEFIKSKIKELHFKASEGNSSFMVDLQKFSALNEFKSYSEYKTAAKASKLSLIVNGTEDDIAMVIDDFDTESSSSAKNDKVTAKSQASLKNMEITSQKVMFSLKKFHYKLDISGLDESTLEEFMTLIATSNNLNTLGMQNQTKSVLTKLLSKGFVINAEDFSLQDFILNKSEDLGGFDIKANITIDADANLAQKLQISPLLFLSNIKFTSKIKLAKAMYVKLLATSPMANIITSYAQEKNDEVLFDIVFEDSALSVNGKLIK